VRAHHRGPGRDAGPKRWIVRGAAGAYVVGAVLVLTPVGGAIGETLSGDSSDVPPAVAQATALPEEVGGVRAPGSTAERPSPALNDDLMRRTQKLVTSHPALLAALDGVGYSIEKSGPWTTIGRPNNPSRLIGTALVLRLDRPIRLARARLPGSYYDESEASDPPYQTALNTITADKVTQLEVQVDLLRGKVVSVEPHPVTTKNLSIRAPKGFVRTVPVPEEGR